MTVFRTLLFGMLLSLFAGQRSPVNGQAEQDRQVSALRSEMDQKVSELRKEMQELRNNVDNLEGRIEGAAGTGLVLYLFGVFCALWAQNTKRNPWLWFFLGLFFSIFTALFLLRFNSDDQKEPWSGAHGRGTI